MSRMTQEKATRIRKLFAEGWSMSKIELLFDLSKATAYNLVHGYTYKESDDRGEIRGSEDPEDQHVA